MSKTESGKTQVSRRTLARGAAWSVPVVATAAAAPAASASVVPGSSSVGPINVVCDVTVPVLGAQTYTWSLTLTATTPTSVAPGDAIPAPSLSASVTTDDNSAAGLRLLGVTSVDGTSSAPYTVTGDVVGSPVSRTASLTIPSTPVPSSGALTTTASGVGSGETAGGTSPGAITVGVSPFDIDITVHGGSQDGGKITGTCTPPAGSVLAPAIQVK